MGLRYLGLWNAVIMAVYNKVLGVDKCQIRVDSVNIRRSPLAPFRGVNIANSKPEFSKGFYFGIGNFTRL